jgi:gluconolactonase
MGNKEPYASKEEFEKRVVHYSDLPIFKMAPNATNRIVSGEKITISFSTMDPNTFWPIHRHENEQIMVVTDGAVDWIVEGKLYHLEKGDAIIEPPNIEHGGYVSDKGCSCLDIFSPARQDMVAKQKEALAKSSQH